jgi:hypothetical protein
MRHKKQPASHRAGAGGAAWVLGPRLPMHQTRCKRPALPIGRESRYRSGVPAANASLPQGQRASVGAPARSNARSTFLWCVLVRVRAVAAASARCEMREGEQSVLRWRHRGREQLSRLQAHLPARRRSSARNSKRLRSVPLLAPPVSGYEVAKLFAIGSDLWKRR